MKKPSISTLVSLLDKPALLGWANKIGLEGISLAEHRKQSASKGTSLHSQIDKFVKEGIPFENPEHEANFLKFMEEHNVEDIYAIEKKVEHDWFVGRYDIYLKANGKRYLCDFKSNTNVYFEQVLQLTAYRMTEKECEGIAVIQIPEFIFKPLNITLFNIYEGIISDLYSIYRNKEHLKEAGHIS